MVIQIANETLALACAYGVVLIIAWHAFGYIFSCRDEQENEYDENEYDEETDD